jgi:bifunctional non-homologous end joining protein LigD
MRVAMAVPTYDPQLALLARVPPEGDSWLHELKLDGFRIGGRLERGRATLLSRRDKDWTAQFPSVAAAVEGLRARSALLDGEVAAVLPDGRTSLHAMGGGGTISYFVFDLLFVDGEDLRAEPIETRKARLRALLGAHPRAPLRFVDHVVGGGAAFFAQAVRHRMEGIISKAAGSPYRSGARNASWQKIKCVLRQEFVLGAYELSTVGGLGAIWLGYHDDGGRLLFAGKVGTGFQREAGQLLGRFAKLERPTPAFTTGLPTGRKHAGVRWLRPELVGEAAFMEWTGHGHIRHASFQGLRPDKLASDVVRERPGRVPPLPARWR